MLDGGRGSKDEGDVFSMIFIFYFSTFNTIQIVIEKYKQIAFYSVLFSFLK